MNLTLVDVFAESRYAGNQLAVVQDAAALDTADMQAIAREMNFSETTFVTAEDALGAQVRIFTPAEELPFAGHPTLGTAWVLRQGRPQVTLHLAVGPVTVRFDDARDMGWFDAPAATLGEAVAPAIAADLLGLAPGELHPHLPPQQVSVGPHFLFVPLSSRDALRRARLDLARHQARATANGPSELVFLFCEGGYSADADYAARLFFLAPDLREDPATGSANAALAAYLQHHLGRSIDAIVEQGFEIQRPSRLYLRADPGVSVGGRVQLVARGVLA